MVNGIFHIYKNNLQGVHVGRGAGSYPKESLIFPCACLFHYVCSIYVDLVVGPYLHPFEKYSNWMLGNMLAKSE
jgi:hypothetical protein